MLPAIFKALFTGVFLSLAYIVWFWIGSGDTSACQMMMADGQMCPATSYWSQHTVLGLRAALSFVSLIVTFGIWAND